MNRRNFLSTLGAAPLAAQSVVSQRPNIILVVADDLGYGDLGCYGQKRIQTPNLDRMASEGIRFTQAYAGSTVCGPSRCSMFTGLHSGHARMRGNTSTWLRPQDVTIAELLKAHGYRTALFGKWSLGELGTTGYPLDKGFDEFYGFFSQMQAHEYYPDMLLDNRNAVPLTGNWGTSQKQYAPDLFTDRGLKFVQGSREPFFLHMAYNIPHANNELGRDTNNGQEVPSDAPYSNEPWPQVERNFAAMVTRLDRDMGRLFNTLQQKGIDRNTLVIFTSDNGPHREGGHDSDFFDSNGPLRGIKRDLYDGGIRVPAIARWPARIQPATSDFVWAFWDLLPTFCELAAANSPQGLDGQSIVPTLTGGTQKPHEYLYWEFHEGGFAQAVRTGDWKGVRVGKDSPVELYNVKIDIGERNNVAGQNPAVVKQVEAMLKAARTESPDYPIKEGRPTNSPPPS